MSDLPAKFDIVNTAHDCILWGDRSGFRNEIIDKFSTVLRKHAPHMSLLDADLGSRTLDATCGTFSRTSQSSTPSTSPKTSPGH